MSTPHPSPEDDPRATPATAEPRGQGRISDHLANQRTLLAWVRTGISIMALGFVVARFGLLLRELSVATTHVTSSGVSDWFGIALVLFGAALVGLSLANYLRIARGIEEGAPRIAPGLDIAMVAGLILAGLVLALYLALAR